MTPGEQYRKAQHTANGSCPLESGLVGQLADHECEHGRLPGDNTKRCGCWAEEGAVLRLITPEPDHLFTLKEVQTA